MGSRPAWTPVHERWKAPSPRELGPPTSGSSGPPAPRGVAAIDAALVRARESLLRLQRPDGHWCGLLEGDSILESEYVLLHHFLGRGSDLHVRRAARRIRELQQQEGGWAIYPGGPPEVSASIKAYFVLRLEGDSADALHMVRARERILELGGIGAANTYTKIYLALFGQWEWARCPVVPPEIVLLPAWSPISVARISSWSRAIFVPLSVLWAFRPRIAVPVSLAELHVPDERGTWPGSAADRPHGMAGAAWRAFFRAADRTLWAGERARITPLRRRALAAAERWMLQHVEGTDGIGAVFPSIVNAIMAFHLLGYSPEDPPLAAQYEALRKHEVERGDTLQLQPSLSPLWDTAQSMAALHAAGVAAGDEVLLRASDWLLARESRRPGDWRAGNPHGPVGGWAFQYANDLYPDCDDTAEVLEALRPIAAGSSSRTAAARAASERGRAWLLSMQNRDGGWGAFDRGCDFRALECVPFADHNAMLDPSSVDVTGRIVAALVAGGSSPADAAIRRAAAFLRRQQDEDGSWYGRWGCNRIYGSWLALTGLAAAGEQPGCDAFARAVEWFRTHQNADGGWGETAASYWDPAARGRGPSTAAQTAWALLALRAAGDGGSAAARGGIRYLLATQRPEGNWYDEGWTATGFPKVFFLQYHLYDDYFPLLALARWRIAPNAELS